MQTLTPELDVSQSLSRGETLPDWWDRAHRNDERVWITNSDPIEIWARLSVIPLFKKDANVLNIGVGTGRCTRGLADFKRMNISALDISKAALDKVADVATGYLAANLHALPSNTFDLALSHLVAQHMGNADLAAQLRHVIRSLKAGGIFAIHYVETIKPSEATFNDTEEGRRAGGVLRSPEFFASMVKVAGGRIIWDQPREEWPARWRVAHITRD